MKETADICIHPWDYAVEPFRIAGPLYYVGNRDVSSHLIDTGEGLILLYTAFPQTVYLLLESIRFLGFNPADIHTILHCHGHYDHFGGTRAITELTGARTAMGEDDAFILTKRPELSWAPEYGVEIECVHIPGHTPGSMSFFFSVSDGNDYTVGIHGGPGVNTLTSEYLTKYHLSRDTRRLYLESLQKLKNRNVDIFIGAHPGQNDTLGKQERMTGDSNPFVSREAWPEFLSQLEINADEAFS